MDFKKILLIGIFCFCSVIISHTLSMNFFTNFGSLVSDLDNFGNINNSTCPFKDIGKSNSNYDNKKAFENNSEQDMYVEEKAFENNSEQETSIEEKVCKNNLEQDMFVEKKTFENTLERNKYSKETVSSISKKYIKYERSLKHNGILGTKDINQESNFKNLESYTDQNHEKKHLLKFYQ